MNTSNLIGLIAQTKQYETHRRKVESIMTKSSHSLSFRRGDQFGSFHSSKDRANRYTLRMKQQAVERENDLMLRKIIDVNRRNSHTLGGGPRRDLSHNNLSNLRRKLEQTNEENQKLANKLVMATSKLSQHLLGPDNRRHAEISERLKKYTMDEDTGMIIPKKIKSLVRMNRLDPLRNSRTEQ